MNMSYEEAKTRAEALHQAASEAGAILSGFPKGPMGLTPDHVKATQAYVEAKASYDRSFEALRAFNGWFTKRFKRERSSDRAKRLAAGANTAKV